MTPSTSFSALSFPLLFAYAVINFCHFLGEDEEDLVPFDIVRDEWLRRDQGFGVKSN